jgi:hypothetical protein
MEKARMGMNGSVVGADLSIAEDAIDATWWAWQRLARANTLPMQADAMTALGNAMADLVTYHRDWDYERGILWNEDDLEDHNAEILEDSERQSSDSSLGPET